MIIHEVILLIDTKIEGFNDKGYCGSQFVFVLLYVGVLLLRLGVDLFENVARITFPFVCNDAMELE